MRLVKAELITEEKGSKVIIFKKKPGRAIKKTNRTSSEVFRGKNTGQS